VDYRMSRTFDVTERAKLEFIAEAFNLFNHPNVSSVTTTEFTLNSGACTVAASATTCPANAFTNNGTFATPAGGGIDNGTNLRERQIQFAVRFKF